MWSLELDGNYFRIFDSRKDVAGYFDPDYGEIFPRENEQEIIEKMLKNKDKISGGYLMVPMIKFGIFDQDQPMNIELIQSKLSKIEPRLSQWKSFLSAQNSRFHQIHVSHTDQDMLSITFPVKFNSPTPLDKKILLENLEPTLNSLQTQGLL